MMDITEQIAKLYNTSPFDLLERDAEHVIMVINYVVMKAEDAPKNGGSKSNQGNKQKDNFWDF